MHESTQQAKTVEKRADGMIPSKLTQQVSGIRNDSDLLITKSVALSGSI